MSAERKLLQPNLTSTLMHGSATLDFRPSGMLGGSMRYWIQCCPACGYVAPDLSYPASVTEKWLKENAVPKSKTFGFKDELAENCYCAYLIAEEEGQNYRAFRHILHAAWACDDIKDTENAVLCRKAAIDSLKRCNDDEMDNDDRVVLMADLLRRCGCFEDVKLLLADFQTSNAQLDAIRTFQLYLANMQNDRCYTIDVAECFRKIDVQNLDDAVQEELYNAIQMLAEEKEIVNVADTTVDYHFFDGDILDELL